MSRSQKALEEKLEKEHDTERLWDVEEMQLMQAALALKEDEREAEMEVLEVKGTRKEAEKLKSLAEVREGLGGVMDVISEVRRERKQKGIARAKANREAEKKAAKEAERKKKPKPKKPNPKNPKSKKPKPKKPKPKKSKSKKPKSKRSKSKKK